MHTTWMSGAGNLFLVVDAISGPAPADPVAFAREVCARPGPSSAGGRRADGVLLVTRDSTSGPCAMTVHNADGSRPEMCGNGLRCVAKLVFERGYERAREFLVATDAGPRPVVVEVSGDAGAGRVHAVTARMGSPRIVARDERLVALGGEHRATLVDVGNPHCVLFVDDVERAPVTTLGPALEKHARFPRHTNVEFLELDGGFGGSRPNAAPASEERTRSGGSGGRVPRAARLRVWERGVGETLACGTGACAAAFAAVDAGRARFPVELELPGGRLTIDDDGAGGVTMRGPVEELAADGARSTVRG